MPRIGHIAAAGLVALGLTGAAKAQPAAEPVALPSVDYTQEAAWLCRPGRTDACRADLDAVAVDAQGRRTPQPFRAAAAPPIDCFYVYPTVSLDPGLYSDMVPGPEEAATARSQAARFESKCRMFAPVYRQFTLAGLTQALRTGKRPDWALPYEDVRAAWREYLARDNRGRGVVLIGHSQGAILLTRLIAEEIDGKPAQRLLVSALLAGHPGLAVPAGREVGGAFKAVPLCRAAGQTGCVVVWSSYAADDPAPRRFFGRSPGGGLIAACVNPAAPGGGRGGLKTYVHNPPGASAGDPPYLETVGQLSAECVSDAQGSVLRVRIEPGRYASMLRSLFASRTIAPSWGLHSLDVSLVEGDLLDLVDAETRSWLAERR